MSFIASSGLTVLRKDEQGRLVVSPDSVEAANLIRADEREQCARLIDEMRDKKPLWSKDHWATACRYFSGRIRARRDEEGK